MKNRILINEAIKFGFLTLAIFVSIFLEQKRYEHVANQFSLEETGDGTKQSQTCPLYPKSLGIFW